MSKAVRNSFKVVPERKGGKSEAMAEGFLNYSLLILLTGGKKGHSGDVDLYYTDFEFDYYF